MKSKKRMAASVGKVGTNKIRIRKEEDVKEALTRDDVRALIKSGAIEVKRKKGVSRARARKLHEQKKKGRRRGEGSKKGPRTNRKEEWMKRVRAQRKFVKQLKEGNKIDQTTYKDVYRKIGGGFFRSVSHIKIYLKKKD